MKKRIEIETNLFEHKEVKPHFINPCCFGEDFALWLKQQLSCSKDFGFDLSEPIQEDYGWGFWASCEKDRYWIAVSFVGNGPQEDPATWIINIARDSGFNIVDRIFHKPDKHILSKLSDHLYQVLASNAEIRVTKTN